MAFSYCFGAVVQHWLGDLDTVQEWAKAALTLSDAHGFRQWFGAATVMSNSVRAIRDHDTAALDQMGKGIGLWLSSGAQVMSPHYYCLLGESARKLGAMAEATTALDEAWRRSRDTGESFCKAEAIRLRGALRVGDRDGPEEAGTWFAEALAAARLQGARSWELRAAMSLAQLWSEQGRRKEARDVIAPVYGWFTEGLGTRDLVDAKALLVKLTG